MLDSGCRSMRLPVLLVLIVSTLACVEAADSEESTVSALVSASQIAHDSLGSIGLKTTSPQKTRALESFRDNALDRKLFFKNSAPTKEVPSTIPEPSVAAG